jgi:hypothetical protein
MLQQQHQSQESTLSDFLLTRQQRGELSESVNIMLAISAEAADRVVEVQIKKQPPGESRSVKQAAVARVRLATFC